MQVATPATDLRGGARGANTHTVAPHRQTHLMWTAKPHTVSFWKSVVRRSMPRFYTCVRQRQTLYCIGVSAAVCACCR